MRRHFIPTLVCSCGNEYMTWWELASCERRHVEERNRHRCRRRYEAASRGTREAAPRSEERCPLCAADITHDREDASVVLDLLYEVRGRLGERDAEALGFLGRAIEMLRERLDARAAPRDEEREALDDVASAARAVSNGDLHGCLLGIAPPCEGCRAEDGLRAALARLDAVRAARG